MVFAQPFWLLLTLAVPIAWLLLRSKGYLGHSNPGLLRGRSYAHVLPMLFLSLGFVALSLALARPQHPYLLPDQTVRARDIVIAVDKSGSMSSRFQGEVPPAQSGNTELDKQLPPLPPLPTLGDSDRGYDPDGQNDIGHRRIDAAQAAVLNFVRNRFVLNSGDRVGVEVFDSQPYWSWPLTRDLKTIYRKLQLTTHGVGGGTNFGEQKPGPIDAAVDQFDELGQSSTRVVIMVTDGEDQLSDGAMKRLLSLMQSRGIRLYVIGVGEALANRDVDIIRLAEAAGGRAFRVENANDLNDCFQTINSLEQSPVKVAGTEKRAELFFYFAGAALVFFLLGFAGEALVLNQ